MHADEPSSGICWFLSRAAPGLRVATVSTVLGDPARFEDAFRDLGDLVYIVPEA